MKRVPPARRAVVRAADAYAAARSALSLARQQVALDPSRAAMRHVDAARELVELRINQLIVAVESAGRE